MYHVLKMSGKFYATDVSHLDEQDFYERVEQFANEGTLAVIVDELDVLEDLGIDVEDVIVVELD